MRQPRRAGTIRVSAVPRSEMRAGELYGYLAGGVIGVGISLAVAWHQSHALKMAKPRIIAASDEILERQRYLTEALTRFVEEREEIWQAVELNSERIESIDWDEVEEPRRSRMKQRFSKINTYRQQLMAASEVMDLWFTERQLQNQTISDIFDEVEDLNAKVPADQKRIRQLARLARRTNLEHQKTVLKIDRVLDYQRSRVQEVGREFGAFVKEFFGDESEDFDSRSEMRVQKTKSVMRFTLPVQELRSAAIQQSPIQSPRDWPAIKGVEMALSFEPDVLYQTAVRTAGTAGNVFPLLTGVWTSGIGPVSPAYPRFLVSLAQTTVTDKISARLARVSAFDLIAAKTAQRTDPIVALHTFENLPALSDPEISVWADVLAHSRQAYLTIEVPSAPPAMRRSLESALQRLILQKRAEAGLNFAGANVKVVQAGDFQTTAVSASLLVYGRNRRRLEQLSAQAERSGRKERLVVADDLSEKNRKALDRAAALLSALDALLSPEAKYAAGIVSASQLMGARMGLVRQLQKLVEQSA